MEAGLGALGVETGAGAATRTVTTGAVMGGLSKALALVLALVPMITSAGMGVTTGPGAGAWERGVKRRRRGFASPRAVAA